MITCKLENDQERELRHVTVSVIAVNERAEVLLVKKSPDAYEGDKYSIPGGFVRRDEDTSIAALRELEKTGYYGKIYLLFQINDDPTRPKEDRQNIDFVYVIHVASGQPATSADFTAIEWHAFDKLPSDEDFAYDHRRTIQRYFQYQNSHFPLPVLGKF